MRHPAKPLLMVLTSEGKPLVDVGVTVIDARAGQAFCHLINSLADDIECVAGGYNDRFYVIQGTAESIGWFFQCAINRVPVADSASSLMRHLRSPLVIPDSLRPFIASQPGLLQPGTDDDGQEDEVLYVQPLRSPL